MNVSYLLMPVETFDHMPVPDGPLVVAVRKFDEANDGLFEACKSYRDTPSPENIELIKETAAAGIEGWALSLKSIYEDGDLKNEVKANMIATLLKGADRRRVEFLEQLLDQPDTFSRVRKRKKIAKTYRKKFEDDKIDNAAFVKTLEINFANALAADINKFVREANKLADWKKVQKKRIITARCISKLKAPTRAWINFCYGATLGRKTPPSNRSTRRCTNRSITVVLKNCK